MKRFVVCSVRAVASCTHHATRTTYSFSQQSEVLMQAAQEHGYDCDLWVDAKALPQLSAKARDGETAVTAKVPRRLEVYNESQLTKNLDLNDAPVNSSVASGMPYRGSVEVDLETARTERGFTSRWWMTGGFVTRRNLSFKADKFGNLPRPVALVMTVTSSMFNVAQLANRDLALRPMSAFSMRPYMGDNAAALRDFASKHKFQCNAFLTAKQAARFGVDLVDGAEGCPLADLDARLYNIEDLEDPAQAFNFCGDIGDGLMPSFMSGKRVVGDELVSRLQEYQQSKGYNKSLWFTYDEIRRMHAKLKAGCVGVSRFHARVLFNVHQTVNPEIVLKKAGTIVYTPEGQ